jgi:predicted enzyme related to lactoylglutathione lyase
MDGTPRAHPLTRGCSGVDADARSRLERDGRLGPMTGISDPSALHGAPSYIELCADDADKARAFYGALLGWTMEGEAGPAQASTGGLDVGIHDRDPSSLLEVFFTVDDLDAAVVRLTELGGRTISEVHAENATFGRWVECQDDQAVRFGLRQPQP